MNAPPAKRLRVEDAAVESGDDGGAELSDADILRLVQDAPAVSLDEAAVRASVGRLRRCADANAARRAQFAATPLQFVDSEVELHAAISAVAAVSTAAPLYGAFLSASGVELLVAQLHHDNSDVANAAVHALSELLDAEALTQLDERTAEDASQRLVSAVH